MKNQTIETNALDISFISSQEFIITPTELANELNERKSIEKFKAFKTIINNFK